ncbi:MAG: NBR1-Ig-like domain-containing protein [Thermoplasmata archaeon]
MRFRGYFICLILLIGCSGNNGITDSDSYHEEIYDFEEVNYDLDRDDVVDLYDLDLYDLDRDDLDEADTPCRKISCAEANAECGEIEDGCGGIIFCGSCEEPKICGGGGERNKCGCPSINCGFVYIENGKFMLDGVEWYPYGINYFPLYSINPPNPPYSHPTPEHWFSDGVYQPSEIEADLTLLENMGINMLAVGLPLNPESWDNFIDFLERCKIHRMKIFLFIPGINPIGRPPKFTNIEELFSEPLLSLSKRPDIFAYDIAWEPSLGRESRSFYNRMFSMWIATTYRDISEASRALGYPIRTSGTGLQAGFISHSVPIMIPAGSNATAQITVRNMGDIVWRSRDNVRLGIVLPNGNEDRVNLSMDVSPGSEITFSWQMQAPPNPGFYTYYFGMLQEHVRWFGEMLEVHVRVVPPSERLVQKEIVLPQPVLDPTDEQLTSDGPWRNMVLAYRRAIDSELSRRFGRIVTKIKELAPYQLVSCRQGWGGNGSSWSVVHYPVDLISTAGFFDFLCPEGYEFTGQLDVNRVRSGMAVTTAYARWVSGGKPVLWAEFGWNAGPVPNEASLNNQLTHYQQFLSALIETGGEGCAAWWYPGGLRRDENSDWGIVNPDRTERPVCGIISAMAPVVTSSRPFRPPSSPYVFQLGGGVRGYADIYDDARRAALNALNRGEEFIMIPEGEGTTSNTDPIRIIGSWGNATRDLWAIIYKVELKVGQNGDWFEVLGGQSYAVPRGVPIYVRAKVLNLGPATWIHDNVRFGANENFGGGFRWPLPYDVPRLGIVEVPELLLTNGLMEDTDFQFQMVAEHRTWIDGAVRIKLVVY